MGWGEGWRARCVQKGGGGGERVVSQHKSTGRSFSRARAGKAEGVRGAGCAWASRRLRAKSVRLPGPRRLARLNQPGVGFWVGTRQRGRAAIAPLRRPWKTGGACCSSSWPLARALPPTTLPAPQR